MNRASWFVLTFVLVGGCKDREEKLKAEEEKANFLAASKARLVKGVGEALKTEGKQAAESVSEGTGEVLKALGHGFEKTLSEVQLQTASDLASRGVQATRAARRGTGSTHAISVYVSLERPYSGPLELRAYDADNREIGRARTQLDEKEATAKYVDFDFDPRTPLLTAHHYELR